MKSILFIILLYLFLYTPPFAFLGGFDLCYVFIVASLFFVIIYPKEWSFYFRLFQKEILFFSIVVFVSFVRSGGIGDYMYIVRHVLSIMYIVTVIPVMLLLSRKLGVLTESKMISGILLTSSIASCISLVCVIIPSFNDYVKNVLIQYQEEDYLFGSINRGFGIASGLTSTYAYIQGTIVALGLYYIKENKWFVFFIPIVFASALVNARTGVLMTFWGFLVLIAAKKRSALIPIVLFSIGFIYYLENLMASVGFNEYTIAWVLDFQDQIGYMYSGNFSQGTAKTMLGMIYWPSSLIEWLMGKGIDLYNTPGSHSDIGWIIQLNYGGLLYIIPLYYVLFVFMPKRMSKNSQSSVMLLMIGVIFICNTKSKIFPSMGFYPFVMFIYYVIISKMQLLNNRIPVGINKERWLRFNHTYKR